MGWFDNFFGGKKTTNTTSDQTATSSTGLTPAVLDYWNSISGQFNTPWQPVGPNQWQTNAANMTPGIASGLNPAIAGANSIGQTGISTGDISRFMNPYTTDVINTSVNDIRDQAAKTGALSNAQATKMGALGGTGGINRNLIQAADTNDTIAKTVSGLRNQGWQSAAGLARDSLQAQLAGFNAAGNLAGLQSNINNTGFGQGTQLWNQGWQNALMPYQLAQMGSSVLGTLSPNSGTTSKGTATGTQTTIGSPSPFSVITNLAGMFGQAYAMSDERIKEDIEPVGETYDGQQIYKYRIKGDPKAQLGLMAQEVEGRKPEAVGSISGLKMVDYDRATEDAVPRRHKVATGGSVGARPPTDPIERFTKAYESISGLLQRSRGGGVGARAGLRPSYAMGGPIAPPQGNWETTVTPASSGFDWNRMGRGLQQSSEKEDKSIPPDDPNILGQQQAALSGLMASTMRRAGGGEVWGEAGPAYEDRPSGLTRPMFVGAPVERAPLPPARASTVPASDEDLYGAIKGFEGFNPRAYGDYKQHSVGYGTRATSPTEVISREEADRRLRAEVNAARGIVDKFAPNLPPGVRAALTSLTFNAGDDWTRAGLGEAIRSGNMDAARERFLQYTKAGGQDLPGLIERRRKEAEWFGGAPVQTASLGSSSGLGGPQQAPRAEASPEPKRGFLENIRHLASTGMMAGKPANAYDKLSLMLMSVGDPLNPGGITGGAAKALLETNQQRIQEETAAKQLQQQLALAMGTVNGQETLEARRLRATQDAQERAAKLERDKALGTIDGQKTIDARRVEADEAQRTAQLTGRLPDGTPTQQGEINTETIAKSKMEREMLEAKMADIKDPQAIYARRKAIADKYGLKEGTSEYTQWIFDGKIPDKTGASETTTQKEVAKTEVEMAQKAIASGTGGKEVLRVTDQLRKLPETDDNFEAAIGPLDDYKLWQSAAGAIPILKSLANPTTSAEIKRMQSQLELAGGEKMKGLGAQSDKDAERLANAISGLSSARNATEYYAALRVIEESVVGAYNRAVEASKKFPQLGGQEFSGAEPRKFMPSADEALRDARAAIEKGANKDAIKKELVKMGIDPGRL